MPYYSLGDTIQCQQTVGTVEPELDATPKRVALHGIESYGWREEELDVLKNVLKQICFSLMYAYEETGFLHNDEHLGNILLRKRSKSHLTYGDIELQLNGMYAVIMDFEKSTVGVPGDVFSRIRKLIHLICVSDKSDIMLDYRDSEIMRLQSANVTIQKEDYSTVNDIIDNIKIRYVKSKVAQMKPKW
jgi:predicted unusual protein kinase regulating ubiquinone biosynthesis (AarF/ABC1/UbiB family)